MNQTPESKSARLQALIHRRDKVLAVLHPPTAAHARIMEKAGCEALFVGTGGVVGAYTGLSDVGTATMTECVTIAGWIADSVSTPGDHGRRHRSRRHHGGASVGAGMPALAFDRLVVNADSGNTGANAFTVMPPYAPGGQDTWDNLWLQRSAAHPWCGMRNMAALIGSGVMDRYPTIRIGTLEAGHGWLPFWMARLDEHAETVKAALPELTHKPSEYVTGGRYFQSIEIPEGARLTNAVIDLVGDQVLMYASDYPHGESHFPESVSLVLDWEMDPERKRKLLWDNAVRFYTRAPV